MFKKKKKKINTKCKKSQYKIQLIIIWNFIKNKETGGKPANASNKNQKI